MRKLLVLAVLAVALVPQPARATRADLLSVNKDPTAIVHVTLPDGTHADTFLALYYVRPPNDPTGIRLKWYGPNGEKIVDWAGGDISDTGRFAQHKMESAHVDAYNPFIRMYDADDNVIATGVTVHVRWTGIGSIHRQVGYHPDGSLAWVTEKRRATVTGWFKMDGVDSLPGSDFSLGKGRLVRQRFFAPS